MWFRGFGLACAKRGLLIPSSKGLDMGRYAINIDCILIAKAPKMAQIVIRSLDESGVAQLKELAVQNRRSMEAEAREALHAWVKRPSMHGRLAELSARLQAALALAAQTPPSKYEDRGGFTHADLARGIGLDFVTPVDQWFEGVAEPTMSQVEAIAEWCGVSNEWLNFGRGAPYLIRNQRIPLEPAEGALWLLGVDNDSPTGLKRLHFVRRNSKAGELMVVREWGVKTDAFHTPYHVSAETGAGGRFDLVHLLLVWKALYRLYTKSNLLSDTMISSHIVSDNIWNELSEGQVNRSAIFDRSIAKLHWWEDIWDKNMWAKRDSDAYWPGWKSLCESLHAEIEANDQLKFKSQQISDGTYPPLQKWF
ncbi:hypothetical protein FE249_18650 (plasmid) [Acidiphilium multivorum]|uniref:FitA-like ribbon-helix-helix domain-containing protein n=1 Tax=Acidiphilium multivorum TaxID=62140 RepID=UPI001F4C3565|nr:hypothetical protein [Acidiphilium multivorum]UNC16240.1 hypothetical protein FE249_18650 [Acidiphilium multivorum]